MSDKMSLYDFLSVLSDVTEEGASDMSQDVYVRFEVRGAIFSAPVCFGDVWKDEEQDVIISLDIHKGY